ncbi:MAG: hypothetical protein J6Y24_05250 [Bacteroidales bacterium]|nr:hypothetical protein [Bacteroidales bacterium]
MRKISVILSLVFCIGIAYGQNYSINQMQGIWVVDEDVSNEGRAGIGEEFYLIKDKKQLFLSSYRDYLDMNVVIYRYGFSDTKDVNSIEQLYDAGKYFISAIEQNGVLIFQESTFFSVSEKESLSFFMEECSYLERLPKKAQSVLYKRGLYDQRNYARDFLEYDICGIKVDNVQLLDSLQNATGTTINKDDIVIVRDTMGDLLQVEYEPEPNKYIKGYLKREDLQFVETKK